MKVLENYYLKHITTEENCEKIVSSGKFMHSLHLPEKKKIQWLGCGIYFWDGNDNDDSSLKIQKRLVKKRRINKGKRTSQISFVIQVEKPNHINLNNNDWEELFIKFLKNTRLYNDADELFDLMRMAREESNVNNKTLNTIGTLFGTAINIFIEVLEKDYKKQIDLVSYSFFHKSKKNRLFGNDELCLKQFCVKNDLIIPKKSNNKWEIKYI